MGDKVRVYEEKRWHSGSIMGVITMPFGEFRYDVRLDKPIGDVKTIFSKKISDLQIIRGDVSIPASNDNLLGTATA